MGKLRPDTRLNLTPRLRAFPYQHEAVEALRDLPYAAVFHEQGLGKTKIAIDILLYWLEKGAVDTVLVVAKKGLIRNWQREFGMHTHIKPQILTQSRKANFHVFNSPARVVLTHFEVLISEKARFGLFLRARDVGVIVDESAKIKNPAATLTQSVLELAHLFKRRVIMTGTPVANRPYDLWSQVYFLDEGRALGRDFGEFKTMTNLTSDLAADAVARDCFERTLERLFSRIASFAVRETKSSGLIALPHKVIETVQTSWERFQYSLYCQYRNDLRAVVMRNGLPAEDKADVLVKRLVRLVQIASNPRLVDQSYRAEPGKLPSLIDLVQRICDQREKCIVWSSFTENVDWLAEILRPFGVRRIHGRLDMNHRDRSVGRFLDDERVRVLVATPGAAKEGLTLTSANHVLFYDRSFSLNDYLQAQDRIHRISQDRTCYVYNLIMPESIDEWVDVLLRSKHLAAMLAQGDIDREEYESQATYAFGDMLQSVLGLEAK